MASKEPEQNRPVAELKRLAQVFNRHGMDDRAAHIIKLANHIEVQTCQQQSAEPTETNSPTAAFTESGEQSQSAFR